MNVWLLVHIQHLLVGKIYHLGPQVYHLAISQKLMGIIVLLVVL